MNEMTAGQEEVDDVILRDVHRTFPEHPRFADQAGQMALFRVLKAYSLHDLEVGYCQVRRCASHPRLLSPKQRAQHGHHQRRVRGNTSHGRRPPRSRVPRGRARGRRSSSLW